MANYRRRRHRLLPSFLSDIPLGLRWSSSERCSCCSCLRKFPYSSVDAFLFIYLSLLFIHSSHVCCEEGNRKPVNLPLYSISQTDKQIIRHALCVCTCFDVCMYIEEYNPIRKIQRRRNQRNNKQ